MMRYRAPQPLWDAFHAAERADDGEARALVRSAVIQWLDSLQDIRIGDTVEMPELGEWEKQYARQT